MYACTVLRVLTAVQTSAHVLVQVAALETRWSLQHNWRCGLCAAPIQSVIGVPLIVMPQCDLLICKAYRCEYSERRAPATLTSVHRSWCRGKAPTALACMRFILFMHARVTRASIGRSCQIGCDSFAARRWRREGNSAVPVLGLTTQAQHARSRGRISDDAALGALETMLRGRGGQDAQCNEHNELEPSL